MKHLILVIILFFVGTLPVYSSEIVIGPVRIIDGVFLKTELVKISSGTYVHFYFQGSDGETYSFFIFTNVKSTGVITLTPVCYMNGDRVFETFTVDDVVYNYFPSGGSGDSGGALDNATDLDSENMVYLGRIELYLLWLLCVQCISCGILLFLCFKGYEKV